jgi:hypothetical protein
LPKLRNELLCAMMLHAVSDCFRPR